MTLAQIQDLQEQAESAFEKDLPQMWLERPGQWVAYRGDERLGFAAQKHTVYQQCLQRGFVNEEIAVFCIEAQETEMFLGPMLMD